MKTNYRITILALAAGLMFAGQAGAQYQPVGDDGIAASPKVRAQLNERNAAATAITAQAPAMACAKCADVQTVQPIRQAKGAQILAGTTSEIVTRHSCTACQVNWTVEGVGKARHSVANHTCTASAPNKANCCASN